MIKKIAWYKTVLYKIIMKILYFMKFSIKPELTPTLDERRKKLISIVFATKTWKKSAFSKRASNYHRNREVEANFSIFPSAASRQTRRKALSVTKTLNFPQIIIIIKSEPGIISYEDRTNDRQRATNICALCRPTRITLIYMKRILLRARVEFLITHGD